MGGAVELVSLADISPSHGWRGSLSQVLSLSSQGMVAAHTNISAYKRSQQRSNRAALVTCCGGAHGGHHLAAPATDNSKFSALRQTLSTRQEQLKDVL